MSVECWCDRCSGYGPRCYEGGEHDYGRNPRNVNCKDCSFVDGRLLAWVGRVARVQKRTGLSYYQAEELIYNREAAIALVRGRLSDRLMYA